MLTVKQAAGAIALAAIVLAPAMLRLSAQIPGLNINVVSIDPFLQKNNEPSLAVSTLNPCHLLLGENDYRTVNLAGLPADQQIGDAWPGVIQSTDCGQTWLAGLMPGFPQDQTPAGLASPAKGLSAGADPVVKAGPGGVFYYSFIAFNRGTNVGKLLLARFLDTNNTQLTAATIPNINPLLVPHDDWPIKYISPTLTVDGGTAQFLDKPSQTVAMGTGTCNFNGRIVPATVVHLVWTVFLSNAPEDGPGGNVHTRVNYNSSRCGEALDRQTTKLSESVQVSQGASVAVHPVTGAIFVVWRSFDPQDNTQGNMMFVRSNNGGKSFTQPQPIPSFAGVNFFDQGTTPTTFRTTALPVAAFDHNGVLHVLAAVRSNNPDQSARINESTTTDGLTWTTRSVISPSPTDEHQIMPAIDYSSGRLRAAWYDFVDDASGVFEQFVSDSHIAAGTGVRHTVDVRGAEAVFDGNNWTWTTFGVIQLPGLEPKISQYQLGQEPGAAVQLLQWNRPNLKLYCGGDCPFLGDYLDVSGMGFVPLPTVESQAGTGPPNWVLNGPATAPDFSRDFHAAWTDNRDAIVDSVIADPSGNVLYSAPVGACDATLTKTRNANIYTSRITPGLSLLLPVNTEPSNLIQRSFPFVILNGTDVQRTVNVSIQNQPPGGGTASFVQVGAAVTTIQVILPPKSSASRTVFVNSSTKYPPIRIFAAENVTNPTLTASAFINPDPTNLDLQGPSAATETHDLQIGSPDIDTPDMENPDLENPDMENPDLENPDLENPDLENPDLENPDLENPDMENPDMENPSLVDGVVTDTTYTLTNIGSDLSAYQVELDVTGKKTDDFFFQLVGRRVYKKPTAKGCQPAHVAQNQVMFNIANPDVSTATFTDTNDPSPKNATFMLFPGESIKLTLRVWDKDAKNNGISSVKDPKLNKFCAFTDAEAGCTAKDRTHDITVRVKAQAANTGTLVPFLVTFVQP